MRPWVPSSELQKKKRKKKEQKALTCDLTFGRLRQADSNELEARLSHTVYSSLHCSGR